MSTAPTGETLKVYSGHSSAVRALAWSPDGSHIASGSYDHTVQVWPANVETGANNPNNSAATPQATATPTPTATPAAAASPTP